MHLEQMQPVACRWDEMLPHLMLSRCKTAYWPQKTLVL